MPLQIRRGTDAERLAMTVPLAPGEPLYTTDQGFLYIGNGSALGGVQVTGYQDENAVDAVGSALTSGIHQNIVFIYNDFPQDVSNRIDAYIDLSYYDGEISAPAFRGSVLDDGSSTLINATNGSINLDGTVKGDIVPDANETYDIGSNSNRFKDLYLSGSSLYLGTAQITAAGSIVDLPVGSTVGGLPISALEGVVPGSNYNANIIADDSSVMVDTSAQQIFAANGFIGNLFGNVTGDILGNVTGNTSGIHTGNTSGIHTGNVTGDVNGNTSGFHTGDVKGSIFADDSTIMVDAVDNTISANSLNTSNLRIAGSTITSTTDGIVFIDSSSTSSDTVGIKGITDGLFANAAISVYGSKGTVDSPTDTVAGEFVGGLRILGYNSGVYRNLASVLAGWDATVDFSDPLPASNLYFTVGGGTYVKTAVFNTAGVLYAPLLMTGSLTTVERDAFIGAAYGMIIYNTTDNKFQGYQNTGGITPEWVDLS
jgi:hypothetical protein